MQKLSASEMTFVEPAPPLDHLAVHDRDLAGGPAERDEAELQPEARGFGECRLRRGHWT
jgi:hypothetical protein